MPQRSRFRGLCGVRLRFYVAKDSFANLFELPVISEHPAFDNDLNAVANVTRIMVVAVLDFGRVLNHHVLAKLAILVKNCIDHA